MQVNKLAFILNIQCKATILLPLRETTKCVHGASGEEKENKISYHSNIFEGSGSAQM